MVRPPSCEFWDKTAKLFLRYMDQVRTTQYVMESHYDNDTSVTLEEHMAAVAVQHGLIHFSATLEGFRCVDDRHAKVIEKAGGKYPFQYDLFEAGERNSFAKAAMRTSFVRTAPRRQQG